MKKVVHGDSKYIIIKLIISIIKILIKGIFMFTVKNQILKSSMIFIQFKEYCVVIDFFFK